MCNGRISPYGNALFEFEKSSISTVVPGDLITPVVVLEYFDPKDNSLTESQLPLIAGYNLENRAPAWVITRQQFEAAFHDKGVHGAVQQDCLRYPSPRIPVIVYMDDGTKGIATVEQGKIAWAHYSREYSAWDRADVSENGRYVVLSRTIERNEGFDSDLEICLLDCQQKKASSVYSQKGDGIDDRWIYEVDGVTSDGRVLLTDSARIKLLSFDGKWNIDVIEIVKEQP